MKNKLPTKSLFLSSTFLAAFICFFLLASSVMEGTGPAYALQKAASGFISFILVSMTNIGLLMLLKIKDASELKKRYLALLGLSLISSTIIVSLMHFKVYPNIMPISHGIRELKIGGYAIYLYLSIQAILLNSLILLMQAFTLIQDANNKATLENLLLKSAKSEAAYELLLQQIHPHFLFNALNILKTLIKKQPDTAEDYVVKLSHFLRSSLTQNKNGTATLCEELKLCINYLEMQKIRFGIALTYSFDLRDEDSQDWMLPVFSLQSLLENVIKHNELTESKPIHIEVKQHEEWIVVTNNIQLRSTSAYSMGNGLTNLAERYELLSGDEIKISSTGAAFSVALKILKINNLRT